MISHINKFIFVHIVKTGGTSIDHSIHDRNYGGADERMGYTHQYISFFAKAFPDEFEKYFKFTIVRNTWSWLVSFFHWFSLHSKYFDIDFETFITEMVYNGNIYNNLNIQDEKRRKEISGFFRKSLAPQHTWNSINGEIAVDFVGRYENLQKDFNIICEKIGIKQIELPRRNVTKNVLYNKHYTEYYNNKTKKMVCEKYAKDIETFNFSYK